MLTKNGGNAWNSKKKSTRDDHRRALGSWPQLRKEEGITKGNEVENWPKLGGTHLRKNVAENQKKKSLHQVESNSGGNVSPVGLRKPSAIPKESKEFSPQAQSNECKNSPSNLKPIIMVSTSDSNQAGQNTSCGTNEKETLSHREEKSLAYKKLQKERKEVLRMERERKKESDTLWKMLGPKGLKVTVIDNNAFSKFCDKGDGRSRSQKSILNVGEVQLDSSAFPELRRSSGKLGVKQNTSHPEKTQKSIPVGDNESTKFITEEYAERTLDANPPRSTKSKKRRDPVVVDIWKAIEICKAGKKMEREEEEEGEDVVRVSKPKEKKLCKVAGNILDASNPSRHRGKKREIPKKRNETRLKKAIMAERRRRRDARSGSKSVAVGNIAIHEAKLFNSSVEASVLVPEENALCSPVQVAQECNLSGNTLELKDVEREEQIKKCFLQPCSDASSAVDIDKMTKDSLHSRTFREYCNHSKSSDLSESVKVMLKDILKFQDRLYAVQPIKAESHRRYVVGLRQTQHLLAVHKVKIVVLAQDLEKVPSPGGLDDVVNSIIDSANKQSIPVVFPLTRRQLGRATYRKVGVSCVGVLNYQGSEENFKKAILALEDSKKDYEEKFEKEKLRIMGELGMLPMKKEDYEGVVNQEQVQPSPIECAVTLPLFQKLTEALSELSIGSASQVTLEEELGDL